MLKRLSLVIVAVAVAIGLSGCPAPLAKSPDAATDPAAAAIVATTNAANALKAAIVAADAAYMAGKLKQADAQKAVASFDLAQRGLDASLASLKAGALPAAPASGVAR